MNQADVARQMWTALRAGGFAPGPAAGVIGNAQAESGLIPDRWEGDRTGNLNGGYGLLQWTPATKLRVWAASRGLNPADLSAQVARILYEVMVGAQFAKPGQTFAHWAASDITPEQAADDFVRYYERPAVVNSTTRQAFARQWYDQITGGVTPSAPTTTPEVPADKEDDMAFPRVLNARFSDTPDGGDFTTKWYEPAPGVQVAIKTPADETLLRRYIADAPGERFLKVEQAKIAAYNKGQQPVV